jgi:hypothetical protein
MVAPPEVDPFDAQKELARRYLNQFGPSSPEAFAGWAGIRLPAAITTFDRLRRSLTPVVTPIGPAWLLKRDVHTMREPSRSDAVVRLLPSGDNYCLLKGAERSLLVPNAAQRDLLWTSRLWPGAILAGGEIVGTWRRSKHTVTAHPWTRLSATVSDAIKTEAVSLPLPGSADMRIEWAHRIRQ